MILSVDPGSKHCGLALWEDKTLIRAWLEKNDKNGHPVWGFPSARLEEIVVERPQVYSARFLRGDPNDLVSIAIVGAELIGIALAYCGWEGLKVVWYYPKTWKGNVDKAAHQPRILNTLTDDERSCIELPRAKSLHHNIIDSVGIGLYHVGRMQRGKTKKAA